MFCLTPIGLRVIYNEIRGDPDVNTPKVRVTPLSWIRLTIDNAVHQRELNKEAAAWYETEVSQQEFRRHMYYGRFAIDSYELFKTHSNEEVCRQWNIGEEDLKMTYYKKGASLTPAFVVFVDHSKKSVVVVVRGTFSISDVLIDIDTECEDFVDARIPQGFTRSAREVVSKSGYCINSALSDNPGYGLVITGHSLGAAVAEVLTLGFRIDEEMKEHIPHGTNVECVALAPPPLVSGRQLPFEVRQDIHIYINQHDCVPRLSTGIGKSLVNTLKRRRDDKNIVYLEHPGHINYIYPKDAFNMFSLEDKYCLAAMPSLYFSRNILMLPGMLTQHMSESYRHVMDNVKFQ